MCQTLFREFALLISTELEREPRQVGTPASVKCINPTSPKLDGIVILFVMMSYVAEYELVLKKVFHCVRISIARSGAVSFPVGISILPYGIPCGIAGCKL